VEKPINHVSGGTLSPVAAIYNRYTYMDEQRAAIALWEDKLGRLRRRFLVARRRLRAAA
jgi:hypothetical protein